MGTSHAFFLVLLVATQAKDDLKARDLAKLQGKWRSTTLIINGTPKTAEQLSRAYTEIEGDTMYYVRAADATRTVVRHIEIDPTKSPATIDMDTGRSIERGIYRIDGDEFMICTAGASGERPTSFVVTPESKVALWSMRRMDR